MIAISLGIVAALCWGLHDMTAKRFADEAGPWRMAFWVMVVGAGLMLPIVVWRGTAWMDHPQGLMIAAGMGLFYAGAIGSLFKAFSLAPVSVVGPFTAGYPALAVFWHIANGYWPSAVEWLALGLAVAGALVVARTGPPDGGLNKVRREDMTLLIAMCVMACVCFASTIILGQMGALAIGQYETTFVSRIPGALALAPLAFQDNRRMPRISGFAWGGIALMALLDVIAVSAVNASGLFPGSDYAAMGISLYGGTSVLLAMLFLKEKVSAGQWFGITLVIAGVALLGWPK